MIMASIRAHYSMHGLSSDLLFIDEYRTLRILIELKLASSLCIRIRYLLTCIVLFLTGCLEWMHLDTLSMGASGSDIYRFIRYLF
jgi:hypothetical protein